MILAAAPNNGGRIARTACAACHGADGNSSNPQDPKLAAQDPNYLYQQLVAFKTGARPSSVMQGIARGLSDTQMRQVSVYYSRQTVRPDVVRDASLAALGRSIYYETGGPMAPSCAMCHGTLGHRGMPMMPGMMGTGIVQGPKLDGQHAAYLIDQLNRFAGGERPSSVMSRIASMLTEREMKAIAAYLSGLP